MKKRFSLVAVCFVMLLFCSACNIENPETVEFNLPSVRVNGNIGQMDQIKYAEEPAELIGGNPWTESLGLTSLPVLEYELYQNGEFCGDKGLSQEDAIERVKQVAEVLHLTVDCIDTSSYDAEKMKEYSSVQAVCCDVVISACLNGLNTIMYKEHSLELPAGCEFDPQSKEQTEKALDWLVEEYSKPLGIENPKSFARKEYNQSGGYLYNACVYSQGEDSVDMLLNYAFSLCSFGPELVVDIENGTIRYPGGLSTIICVGQLDLMQRKDDYPIISAEEAREQLLSGNFYSEADEDESLHPSDENIACVELVYDTTNSEIRMPYYRFWVSVPQDYIDRHISLFSTELIEAGAMPYFSFYVPAIQADYLDTTNV